MLDSQKVDAFIEETLQEIERLDAECNSINSSLNEVSSKVSTNKEIEDEANALLAEAKLRAEEEGKRRSLQVPDINQKEKKVASSRRMRNFI